MQHFNLVIIVFLGLSLSGCVTPSYTDQGKVQDGSAEINPQDVNFKTSSDYDMLVPRCVFVIPSNEKENRITAQLADTTLARHLGEKIERVIFPKRVDQIARKNGYDIQSKSDQKRFAREQRCPGMAIASLYDLGDDYALIYSQKYIGIKLDFYHIDHEKPLWEAAHTVWRADGGLPLNPLAAAGGIAQAALFSQDDEILFSIMDDAVRRMMRTMPPAY